MHNAHLDYWIEPHHKFVSQLLLLVRYSDESVSGFLLVQIIQVCQLSTDRVSSLSSLALQIWDG